MQGVSVCIDIFKCTQKSSSHTWHQTFFYTWLPRQKSKGSRLVCEIAHLLIQAKAAKGQNPCFGVLGSSTHRQVCALEQSWRQRCLSEIPVGNRAHDPPAWFPWGQPLGSTGFKKKTLSPYSWFQVQGTFGKTEPLPLLCT
jgi:hypothetical protein